MTSVLGLLALITLLTMGTAVAQRVGLQATEGIYVMVLIVVSISWWRLRAGQRQDRLP